MGSVEELRNSSDIDSEFIEEVSKQAEISKEKWLEV